MAFKMKGNPMQRNFGIGSPVKHKMDKRGFEHGNKHHSETVSDDSGTGHSKSPAKNRITDLTGMDKRGKQAATAHNDAHASGGDPHSKKSPAEKKLIGAQNNLPEELKAKIEASPAKKYKSNAQRKAVHASKAEKGSMAKMYDSPTKKYDSPVKQEEFGGTKSKRGNIFTGKGKIQRKINRSERAEERLRKNANKEGFDTKKSKKLMDKHKKTYSKTSFSYQNYRDGDAKRKAGNKLFLETVNSPEFQRESPAKQTSNAEKRANLLKAVPNKAAYDKLSDMNKKGFDKAGKEAGLPQKKATKA